MTAYDSAALYDSSTIYDGVTARPLAKAEGIVLSVDSMSAAASFSYPRVQQVVEISRGASSAALGSFDPGRLGLDLVWHKDGPLDILDLDAMSTVAVNVYRDSEMVGTIFTGWVDSTKRATSLHTSSSKWVERVSLQATDGFKLLSQRDTYVGGSNFDKPADRISAILASCDWSEPTSIDTLTDVRLTQGTTDRRSALTALRQVEAAESGSMYFTGDGTFVFRGRQATWPSAGDRAPVFTFSDDQSDTHAVTFSGATRVKDDAFVANRVSVTSRAAGSTEQTASDTALEALYGIRGLGISDCLVLSDTEALALAEHMIAQRSLIVGRWRYEALEVAAYASEVNLQAALTLDLMDPIRVEQVVPPSVASRATTTQQIVGIRHRITPADWRTTYTTRSLV